MTIDVAELRKECRRQEESCKYTSTSFFIWLRAVRCWRTVFVATPIVLGGIGSWGILNRVDDPIVTWGIAVCALLAGLFPALFKALELDERIAEVSRHAAAFKNLQDRFRQAANIGATRPPQEFDAEFQRLMKELEAARAASITPPERYFTAAKKKIASGHYDFDVDGPPH